MKTIKQTATITSIDNPNKVFEVKVAEYPTDNFTITLESDEDGNVLLPMLSAKLGDNFEVGDVIEFKKLSESDYEIVNLTCELLRLSKFKRDLISVLRRLDKDDHSLKRCVLLNEKGFVLLSTKKNKEKLILLQNQLDDRG
jgi:hypothetical protein